MAVLDVGNPRGGGNGCRLPERKGKGEENRVITYFPVLRAAGHGSRTSNIVNKGYFQEWSSSEGRKKIK